MKLKSKIHIFSTLLMFVILVLAMFVIYFLFQKMSYDAEYDHLLTRSKELTTALSQMTSEKDAAIILRAFIPADGTISILDHNGRTIVYVQSLEGHEVKEFEGMKTLTLTSPIIWPTGEVVVLEMTQYLTEVMNHLRVLKFVLIGVLIFAMIPIILSSVTLGRIVTRPINELITAMKTSRKSGKYEKMTSNVNGKDELAEMERAFNEMMEQLEQNYTKQEQFVSNASHELKTPLTVIESYSRLLERRGFDNREVADEALSAIITESGRMKEMITQMLDLAKNTEIQTLEFVEVDVHHVLKSVITPFQQAYGRNIILNVTGSHIVETDARLIKQVLFILFDNARKYSEKEIEASVTNKEKHVEISVKDYGKGIPSEDLPHIFDRFYRVDSDRNRKTGGTGLGLSIAKEITERLGAKLTIESVVGMGTMIRLVIPKKKEVSQ